MVKQICNATAKKFSAEDKIRIALEDLRVQIRISELYRKEEISAATYYKWSKDFLDGGKKIFTHIHDGEDFATGFEFCAEKDIPGYPFMYEQDEVP